MQIEQVEINKLIPYARNSRTHSDAQVAQIAASIKEFGFTNPVLVDNDNGIIAGHGRVLGALKLAMNEVPCIRLGYLTEAQRRAYVIADNKIALNAGWDEEMLRLEVGDLKNFDFDLSLTGFDSDEINQMLALNDATAEGNTDEDEVPEVQAKVISTLGDVWLLGKHRVMCGDSTSADAVSKLLGGGEADMVFTDPPYGVNYDGGHANENRREKLVNDDNVNMYDLPVKNAYLHSKDNAPIYIWFADRFANEVLNGLSAAGYQARCWIIWNKNLAQFGAIGAQYKSKHEPCIYAFKRGNNSNWAGPTNETTVWDVPRENANKYHPTQKPVALCERAIKNHKANMILDLFGGSGSSLIACEKTGRIARMMELDPKYCDVIVRRWQNFTGKQAVLESSSKTFAEIEAQ
jgi:DNA modification methylase